MNHLKFCREKLPVAAICELVSSKSCGATSLFVGTTRDNFEGQEVLTLEYEAYETMGLKCFKNICAEIRRRWPSVEHISIYHRLGTVPVEDVSIVVAISAPHRKEALSATEWCVNIIKSSAPIWKKEVYADSTSTWKENKECRWSRTATK